MINFDKMFEDFDPDEFYIKKIKPTNEHSEEVRAILVKLYALGNNEKIKHRLATILNSVFTQQNQTFLMSKDSLDDLFHLETESRYRAISGPEYKELLYKISHSKLFEVLRKPTSRKAGVYKLVDPDLVDILQRMVGAKFLEEQEQKAIEYYDGNKYKPSSKVRSFSEHLKEKKK